MFPKTNNPLLQNCASSWMARQRPNWQRQSPPPCVMTAGKRSLAVGASGIGSVQSSPVPITLSRAAASKLSSMIASQSSRAFPMVALSDSRHDYFTQRANNNAPHPHHHAALVNSTLQEIFQTWQRQRHHISYRCYSSHNNNNAATSRRNLHSHYHRQVHHPCQTIQSHNVHQLQQMRWFDTGPLPTKGRSNKQRRSREEAEGQKRLQPKQQPHKQQKQGGSAGRIALVAGQKSHHAYRPAKIPILCTGCGVEIITGSVGNVSFADGSGNTEEDDTSHMSMAAGIDAVDATSTQRSKRQTRKARYADIFDTNNPPKKSKKNDFTSLLCPRCKSLQRGDVFSAYDALKDVDAAVFSSQLEHIVSRRKFGVCVVVVDATDPEFTAVRRLRDYIKSTPCILVVNKIDLLPRKFDHVRDLNFLRNRVENNKVNMIDAYGVSSNTGEGIIEFAEGLLEHLMGRDAFIVGSANVRKSSLVKLLSMLLSKTMWYKEKPRKVNALRNVLQNLKVTSSHLPGTTLQALRIPCFPSARHALWDTPGIINKSALAYSLFPSHLMEPLATPKVMEVPTGRDNGGGQKKWWVKEGYSILIEARWVHDFDESGVDQDTNSDEEDEEEMEEGIDESHRDENFAMNDEDDDDTYNRLSRNRSSFGAFDKISLKNQDKNENRANFTLARLDIISTANEGKRDVQALAFVHPSLKIRVVPTELAPKTATIPREYVEEVQRRVGKSGNFFAPADGSDGGGDGSSSDGEHEEDNEREVIIKEISRPLCIYKGDNKGVNSDGTVEFHAMDVGFSVDGDGGGWVRRDIVFASLGWLMLNSKGTFKVRPWCVKGSLWSKRKPFYPSNIEEQVKEDMDSQSEDDDGSFAPCDVHALEEDTPEFKEIKTRLRAAAEKGRHNTGSRYQYGMSSKAQSLIERKKKEISDWFQ